MLALIASLLAFVPQQTAEAAQETFGCGTSGSFTKINNEVTTSSNCVGSVTIPEGVTVIADGAFFGKNAAITALSLPTTLVTISDNAFRVAGSIATLNIPANVVTIGERAFSLNTAPLLTTLTFSPGSKLEWIKSFAFEYSNFTSVTIPSSVTTIGQYAFVTNSSLSQINFLGAIPSGSPWSAPSGVTISRIICDGSTRTCQVGDNGPGGGIIFYVSTGTFTQQSAIGSMCSTDCKYLEVAPSDWNGASEQTVLLGNRNDAVKINDVREDSAAVFSENDLGLGYKNTLAFNADSRAIANSGVKLVRNYRGGTRDDWYVPTSTELNLLVYWSKGLTPNINARSTSSAAMIKGDFDTTYWYYNSSQTSSPTFNGHIQGFSTGAITTNQWSDTGMRVRPIRAFGTPPAVISVAAIGGVTAPASGATPVSAVTSANGYTGTVTWSGSPTTFATSTAYTATITLTAASGYTFSGVTANFFTVAGATTVTHSANSGTITAVFPATGIAAPAFNISSSSETVTAGTAITGYTITSTGGTVASYSISPAITNTPGLSFSTSTGLISGTPTTAAVSRTYTITAINATSPNATRTFAITVNAPLTPGASIGTTTFAPGVAANVGITVSNLDQTQSYQATVKFVNTTTNVEVENGTLTATKGGTTPNFGFTYSGTKLGFKGTYAAVSAALASVTWTPAVASGGISMRIGISTAPAANEFYDANSGHYYRYVSTGLSAIAARAAAEQSILFGLRGYLVEITSEAENAFIAKETESPNIWIGASDRATEGTFIWDGASNNSTKPTGSGSSALGNGIFSSWSGSEPNDHWWDQKLSYPEREDCVLTNWYGAGGLWNDYPCRQVLPYLIEYGGRPSETSTATSATLTATVTAVNPPTFTAQYNSNGAVGSLAKVSDTYVQGRTQITLPGVGTLTKTGYTFAGWSESGTAPVISGTYAPTANVTLKAVWTPIQYTVTYDVNGGDLPTPTETSKTIGQTFNLSNPITRASSGGTSYQFAFWKSAGSGYKAGSTITVGSTNLNFTATWIQLYEVTYGTNGGTFSGTDTEKDGECAATPNICSNNQAITLNSAPTRTGFTFAGWEDQGGNLVTDTDSGTTGVQTTVVSSRYIFTARWTTIPYTVTYVSTGSPEPTQGTKNIGQLFTVGAAVTKPNFDFAGWNDGTTTYWPDSEYLVGSLNVTLTALWTAFYSVTYSEGLGTGTPPSNSVTYRTGDAFEVLAGIGIERAAFSFNGWNDGTTTYQPGATYTVGANNLTLTAQWVPVFSVAYAHDLGPTAGTTPSNSVLYRTGNTFTVLSASTLTNPRFTFNGWNDGTRIYQPGATYTVGTSNITLAARWLEVPEVIKYPEQTSSITSIAQNCPADSNTVVIKGSFLTPIANISINNQLIDSSRWKQTATQVEITINSSGAGTLEIRIYNGQVPVLPIQTIVMASKCAVTPLTPKPTPTPKPTATPTAKPTPTPTATSTAQPTAQMAKVATFYMASGSYFLNDETKKGLIAIAKTINASPAKSILVYGHADNRGGVNNTVLSQNRAKAVAAYLRPLLTVKKISIGWYSSKKPVKTGTSAADLALNRRVEIYTK